MSMKEIKFREKKIIQELNQTNKQYEKTNC